MMKKRRIQIVIIVMLVVCVYIMNHIAFFKDREFEEKTKEGEQILEIEFEKIGL